MFLAIYFDKADLSMTICIHCFKEKGVTVAKSMQ